jgi:predicted TIM-barrel fold metal-dependent hydrolase
MSTALPWVISVDDHVVEPPTVWTDRLPVAMRDRGPHVVQDTCEMRTDPRTGITTYHKGGDGPRTDWWVFEDALRPLPQVIACAGFPPEEFTLAPIPFSDMRPGCYDRDARIADMDINRTERSLCFPTFPRFAGQMFMEAKDLELGLLGVRAYNDWMMDEWCDPSGGRLIPLCLIPLWDADLAAAEIRRNATRGCRAVAFTELPSFLGLPSIHDRDGFWDPFFDACNETGTTIHMHIGSGSKMPKTSDDAPSGVGVAVTSINAYMSMADWLLSGVLARFPNIKIAFSESQIGWMPFLIDRCDRVFRQSTGWADISPAVTELPSSYVPGRVYGCFFDDMVGIDARHEIGVGQIVFETDYPHQDSTWPNTTKVVAEIAERVSSDELERIMRTNAIELLDLDPVSLVPAGFD